MSTTSSPSRSLSVREAILARIPALLLSGIYLFVVTRDSGQIDALFDTLVFPFDHIGLLLLAILTSAALTVLASRPRPWLRVVDFLIFLVPPMSLVAAFHAPGTPAIALAVVATASAIGIGWLASSVSLQGWRATGLALLLTLIGWFAVHHAIIASPVEFPRKLGAIGISFLFVGFCAVALKLAVRHLAVGLPVLVFLGYAFFSYQETHAIQQYDQTHYDDFDLNQTNNVRWQVSLQQTFKVWLQSRNDLEAYAAAGKPYPIFVVASEGGGGYAAAHANLFLSKLQQRCPNFAQHLFAMVGVSGGSVGNTQFQASLPETTNFSSYQGCAGKPDAGEVLARLSEDHLSPVLAVLLFQDFPNKLLFGMFGSYDRSEALAASLSSSAWKGGDDVERLYWNHFWRRDTEQPALAMGESPALIFVATNAVSGKRYVFAPFAFPFNNYRSRFEEYLRDMNWSGPDEVGARQSDVRLIDGAVASASFPWVTPSRVLQGSQQETISLVDGGYLENSGAETARDIIDAFIARETDPNAMDVDAMQPPKSFKGNPRLDRCETIAVVYSPPPGSLAAPELPDLAAAPDPCSIAISVHFIAIRAEVPYLRSAERQSFFLDPLTALLSARSRRAETARFGLLSQLCGGLECPEADFVSTWRYYESVIATDYLTLPLGWYLPADRLKQLEPFVAPDPSDVFDLSDYPEGSMPSIIDAQLRAFGSMKDNPTNMGSIEAVLDPAN